MESIIEVMTTFDFRNVVTFKWSTNMVFWCFHTVAYGQICYCLGDSVSIRKKRKARHTLQADHVHLQAFIFMDCAAEVRGVNEETQIWEADLMRSHLKPFTWVEDRGAEPKRRDSKS